jgi:hypothetical protein
VNFFSINLIKQKLLVIYPFWNIFDIKTRIKVWKMLKFFGTLFSVSIRCWFPFFPNRCKRCNRWKNSWFNIIYKCKFFYSV